MEMQPKMPGPLIMCAVPHIVPVCPCPLDKLCCVHITVQEVLCGASAGIPCCIASQHIFWTLSGWSRKAAGTGDLGVMACDHTGPLDLLPLDPTVSLVLAGPGSGHASTRIANILVVLDSLWAHCCVSFPT